MPTIVTCPGCATPCTIEEGQQKQSLRCPRCGKPFVVSPTLRPAPAATPTSIGRYQTRARLGSGAFGTVYRAYDPHLDREVALKVLRPEALSSPRAVERFGREARAAAKMLHANIVPVYDAGTHGDSHYIASAFIDGQTLAQLIPDGGMDPHRAVRLVVQLLDALAYAHQQNVLHRDVKPANVLVDARDHLYLTDFGLAGFVQEEARRLTRLGTVMGTPAYVSPEQAAGATQDVGPSADQYSAAVVLYELLAGTIPFEGPVDVVLFNVLRNEPQPPSTHRPDLDARLEKLCLKAMAKKPAQRYADVAAFATALRDWQANQATLATGVTSPARSRGETPTLPTPEQARETINRPSRPTIPAERAPAPPVAAPEWATRGGASVPPEPPRKPPQAAASHSVKKDVPPTPASRRSAPPEAPSSGREGDPAARSDQLAVKKKGARKTASSHSIAAPQPREGQRGSWTLAVAALLMTVVGVVGIGLLALSFFSQRPRRVVETPTPNSQPAGPTSDQEDSRPSNPVPTEEKKGSEGPPEEKKPEEKKPEEKKPEEKSPSPKPVPSAADALKKGRLLAPDVTKAKLLVSDDFAKPTNNLPNRKFDKAEGGYRKGLYFMRDAEMGRIWNYGDGIYSAMACELVGRLVEPNNSWGVGIAIPSKVKEGNAEKDSFQGVQVEITHDAKVLLRPFCWDAHQEAKSWRGVVEHPAIKPADQFNALLVVCRGRQLEIYVNGVAICEPVTLDRDCTPGRVYLHGHKGDKELHVEFQRLRIWSAEGLPTLKDTLDRLLKDDEEAKGSAKGKDEPKKDVSNNKGKIEGTKWSSDAVKLKDKDNSNETEYAAGFFVLEFGVDMKLVFTVRGQDKSETVIKGKYSLGSGDDVILEISDFSQTEKSTVKITIKGDKLSMTAAREQPMTFTKVK